LAIDNAGTVELAVVNIAGNIDLTETGLISTTAEGGGGAADSSSTVYAAATRSNLAYRVVGYVESTQGTAGTWATAPSTIQGCGGQALVAMSSIGYGQTWQNFTVGTTRVSGTTYYNTTGKPLTVMLGGDGASTLAEATPVVGGVTLPKAVNGGAGGVTAATSFIVPPGMAYSVTINITGGVFYWAELR
jgi:hypothetical protein